MSSTTIKNEQQIDWSIFYPKKINYEELYKQLKKEHEELKQDYKGHKEEFDWFYNKKELKEGFSIFKNQF